MPWEADKFFVDEFKQFWIGFGFFCKDNRDKGPEIFEVTSMKNGEHC